ncbi:MAG: hypothetical protein NTY35_03755 [Planctomycetota bacterium]|nr:hypothetical protein [Planctomycetota bacterium]
MTLAVDARSAAQEPLAPPEGAQVGVVRPTAISVESAEASVHVDRPGDGALWARGRRWKASFDEGGATYYAGFGPRQPRSLPHTLSPDRVTVGGAPLDFARSTSPRLLGDRVEIDRGAFVEAYELGVESIEQLFVFDTLPRAGEIVVRIPIASELDGVEADGHLEFRGEHGRVTYSRAVAIDASGRRAAAPTRLVDGMIQITVDAEFLASADLPLVIDPVVTQFWLDSFTENRREPDMAWDPFHQVWMAVYEEVFSATDTDIVVKMLNSTGSLLVQSYVDSTSASWTKPRIANNGSAHVFLAVAERSSSNPKAVMGRTVAANGTIITVGSQFDLGGSLPGDKLTPDVGGDPTTSGSTSFCVVFERTVAAGDSEIGYRMVSSAGVPAGAGPTYFADAFVERNMAPSISRSNGGSTWLLAWVNRVTTPLTEGVLAARVGATGTVVSPLFAVSGVQNAIDIAPCASSPLASSQRCAITFARRPLTPVGAKADIFVVALDGATVLQTLNLTALEASGMQSQEQIDASVDSDGQHFLVAYTEFDPVFSTYNTFASDLYLAGNQLGLAQSHVQLHPGLGLPQFRSQVAAMRSPASLAHRYGVIYEVRSNDQNYDISAVLFDGVVGGATSAFCAGDGSTINCPCGNNGINGRGCGNSANLNGAALTASGFASTADDTLRLQASGMPQSTTCLFFQGSAQASVGAFGDGLLCTGGTTIRLATKTSPLGAAQFPAPGSSDPSISARGAVPLDGGQRFYQVWYRNSAAFCTSATFNLTSGIRVSWAL